MSALIGLLDGISPWWWVALALVIAGAEVVTFTYYMLWLSLAALAVAGLLAINPETSGAAQLGVFAILAVVFTIVGWKVTRRRAGDEETSTLNKRAAALIGRQAIVAAPFRAGIGPVEIDGIRWRGRLVGASAGTPGPAEGDAMQVVGADGMVLLLDRPSAG